MRHYLFFFNDTATTEIYTPSLHDALPICIISAEAKPDTGPGACRAVAHGHQHMRSEEHTSELQSQFHLVCRLLLEKKNPAAAAAPSDCAPARRHRSPATALRQAVETRCSR